MKVGDVMTKHPVVVDLDTSVRVAVDLMRSKGIRPLPVVDAGHRVKAPRVRDVMTWSVVTTQADTPLVQAALTMFQRRIGSLPVVEDSRLVGILTEHDVFTGLTKGSRIEAEAEFFLW